MPRSFVLWGAVAILVLIWGTTWAAIRIGLRGVPPFTGAAMRFAVSSAVLFAAHPLLRIPFDTRPHVRRLWLVNGVLLFFISYGTIYWTEQSLPSGLTAIFFATYPLLVAVVAHYLLPGERASRRTWLGVVLGFVGVAMIYSEDLSALGGTRARIAATIVLLSPIACAFANVLVKKQGVGVGPMALTAVPMAIGAIGLGSAALVLERGSAIRFDTTSLVCLGYLALFGSVLTFALFFWLLARYPATKLALIAYGSPVVAVITGTAFLGERFTARMAAGALTVLAGVAIATRSKR